MPPGRGSASFAGDGRVLRGNARTDPTTVRVLMVEDSLDDAHLMAHALKSSGLSFTSQRVDTEPGFRAALNSRPDVVLCDHTLPQFSAGRAFEIMRERNLRSPVLIVSGTISDELAVEFMRQGASDYVLKDRLARLGPAVSNALDRHRLENVAVEANLRLEHMMNELEVAAVASDGHQKIVSCNDVAWRWLGYESAEAFRAVPAPMHFKDQARHGDLVRLLNERHKVHGFEAEYRRADGGTVWTTGEYSTFKNESGEITGIEALMVDSTVRKRAEEETRTTRERLDAALRNAPIVTATLDSNLVFTFAGGTALEPIGLVGEAMVGQSAREILRSRPDIVRLLERAVAGEEFIDEGEFAGRYFHVKFSPIAATEGHPAGTALVGVDITARHAAEVKAETRARQQAAARQLAQEALDDAPIPQLMTRAVRLTAAALDAEMAVVHRLEPDQQNVTKLASVGYREPERVVPVIDGSMISRLIHNSDASSVDDYQTDGTPCPSSLAREGVCATMGAAIRDEKRTFGFLSVHSRTPRHWTCDEREFLELMSRTLWVELERQRLEAEQHQLISRLVNAQEQERQRIAADVHDDAVQVMSAVTMRLHLLSQQLTEPEQLALVARLQATVTLAIERLRSLLFQLNPPALERHGLVVVISTLLDEFQRDFGIVAEFENELASDPNSAAGLIVYRIVQESLANVHKHSHAKRVNLHMRRSDGGVLVTVADDGCGFDPADGGADVKHIGLSAMRERAELAGGWWKVLSVPGSGTQINFWIPAQPRTLAVMAP